LARSEQGKVDLSQSCLGEHAQGDFDTMTSAALIERCHQFANSDPEELNADSLIGFFQLFRPDGAALSGLFDQLEAGEQLHARLEQLYASTGDDRRPSGGRDAYFVVRRPPAIDSDQATELGQRWLSRLAKLAEQLGDQQLADALTPLPKFRVLEGQAPKHPKAEQEKSALLKSLQAGAAELLQRIEAGPHAADLRPAYYFIACDTMLRDYLMWPLYAAALGETIADPFEPYFRLWQHGIKYRIFGNDQVDLYLPRQLDYPPTD
jgi:hypothetical protein